MSSSVLAKSSVLITSVVLLAAPSVASDPIGVFALIDRVSVVPNAENPETIQIWGVFALSPRTPGNAYLPAQRGYLYYSVNGRNERATRAEWSDLATAAGSGQVIGFGARFENPGRVRRASEAPKDPDVYPLGFGLAKSMQPLTRHAVERDVASVPNPVAPADGARAQAGQVQLTVATLPDTSLHYVFEITGPNGEKETSKPVTAGKSRTVWTPQLRVRNGQSYTWRVWTVKEGWTGQAALATFRAEP
jgi:hypothetical protein